MKKHVLVGLLSILGISLHAMEIVLVTDIDLIPLEAEECTNIQAPGTMVMTCEQAFREYLKRKEVSRPSTLALWLEEAFNGAPRAQEVLACVAAYRPR